MINLLTQFAAMDCTKNFFGLKPWFEYLDLNSKCEIVTFTLLSKGGQSSDIPLILLAVIDDLLRIAGTILAIFAYAFLYAFLQFLIPGGIFNR